MKHEKGMRLGKYREYIKKLETIRGQTKKCLLTPRNLKQLKRYAVWF